MPETAATLPQNCPNCSATVHGPFCAQCGQETVITIPRWREFAHEYATQFVSLDGRLWRTLRLLLFQPGALTLEFIAGRRRRFVRPLPLYLSTSFLLFLLLTVFPAEVVRINVDPAREAASSVKPVPSQSAIVQVDGPEDLAWLERLFPNFTRTQQRFKSDPQEARKRLTEAFTAKLPGAVFVLVPLFAVGSRLLYRRRRRPYMEHLLFALHLHAFVFLTLALAFLLPGVDKTGWLLPLWWLYLALALRRVFAGRLWPQLLRAAVLTFGHGLLLTVALIVALLLAIPAI